MSKPNREAGSFSPEQAKPEEQKKTHANLALERVQQEWEESNLKSLLTKLNEVFAKGQEDFNFIFSELNDSTMPLAPTERKEKIERAKKCQKELLEKIDLIQKLRECKLLREKYALYSGSIGDWMELYAKYFGIDFNYNPQVSLVKQLEALEASLPVDKYKELETYVGRNLQESLKASAEYNEIVKELETTAKVYVAEELDRQGFWADQLPQ